MHSLVNNHILQFVYLVYLVLYLGLLFPSLLCERLFLEVPHLSIQPQNGAHFKVMAALKPNLVNPEF